MHYVEVLVASNSYHGDEALTYGSDIPLVEGTTVLVPLRNRRVSGIVLRAVNKPAFTVKPVVGTQINTPIPKASMLLMEWLSNYYPAPSGAIVSQFLPSNLLIRGANVSAQSAPKISSPLDLPPLTSEQTAAMQVLSDPKQRSFLLHGDTGTGKTRIYIELAKRALADNKNVLVLTPEIGLTSQLAQSFNEVITQPVLVMHSNLTEKERRTLWLQVMESTEPLVVVGPRSALFAPFNNLGLIVVDEAHDTAYKQDQAPHYHGLRVAGKLAELHQAQLIYGSATPLVSEYFVAKARGLPIIRMTTPAAGTSHDTNIITVDTRDRSQYSRNPYLSDILLEKITEGLSNKEQSLVFLNRRGTARVVLCQKCGWQALCPNCDLPLTYHGDNHSMRCHTCGYHTSGLTSCPSCSTTDIVYRSVGTKALADSLQALFPQARVQRFDTDNTKDEKFESHYHAVKSGDVDILVGTQMLVKGLDLPKLSTVGVVAADSSLYFPDFTAEEQTYQLLTQVVGRVGRGHRKGSVVIQTYNIGGKALQAVLNKNWDEFYKQQIAEREQFKFPPFVYLLKLSCSRKSQNSALQASNKLLRSLLSLGLKVEIIGPSPRFKEFSRGEYSWQLIVKSRDRKNLLTIIDNLPSNWIYDIDPTTLL